MAAESTATSSPTTTPEPSATTAPTATPAPAITTAPTDVPVAGADPEPVPTTPQIALAHDTFTVGTWGDGLDITGGLFHPGDGVRVSIVESGVELSGTTATVAADGTISVLDWDPVSTANPDITDQALPHQSVNGDPMNVEVSGRSFDGSEAVTSNSVPLDVELAGPSARLSISEDNSPVADGASLRVETVEHLGLWAQFAGFERDESVQLTLRAPDGSEKTLDASHTEPLYGSVGVELSGGFTAPFDQFGRFTVTATGSDSARTASIAFDIVPSTAPGISIWPRTSSDYDYPADYPYPRSGGALWGFGAAEQVVVGIYDAAAVRQQLVDGGTTVSRTVNRVGFSPLSLGDSPLAVGADGVYCVVAVGAHTGRTASTTFEYSADGSFSPTGDTDCSQAVAAATRTGTTVVTAGSRSLASTGVSTEAPLALAGLAVLAGIALVVTRRFGRRRGLTR
ncbi:LPXTG cell wall anchor domain-containing protein [Microbacteriaceae bacterium VKM Ac-2854]|nr:LPXTG cell wall anchor domain-containing protein [Microbacteriaceae bacterium VKM Ac-2854]